MDYKTKKIKGHENANCVVKVFENGDICLRSYYTDVLYYDSFKGYLYCSGLYSQTTRKHIGWFVKEYFPKLHYYDIKYMFECNMKCHYASGYFNELEKREKQFLDDAHYNGCSLYPNWNNKWSM